MTAVIEAMWVRCLPKLLHRVDLHRAALPWSSLSASSGHSLRSTRRHQADVRTSIDAVVFYPPPSSRQYHTCRVCVQGMHEAPGPGNRFQADVGPCRPRTPVDRSNSVVRRGLRAPNWHSSFIYSNPLKSVNDQPILPRAGWSWSPAGLENSSGEPSCLPLPQRKQTI